MEEAGCKVLLGRYCISFHPHGVPNDCKHWESCFTDETLEAQRGRLSNLPDVTELDSGEVRIQTRISLVLKCGDLPSEIHCLQAA